MKPTEKPLDYWNFKNQKDARFDFMEQSGSNTSKLLELHWMMLDRKINILKMVEAANKWNAEMMAIKLQYEAWEISKEEFERQRIKFVSLLKIAKAYISG